MPATSQFDTATASSVGNDNRDSLRHRRRFAVVTSMSLVGLVAAALGVAVTHRFGPGAPANGATDNGSTAALATVARRALSSQTSVNGTLGYAGGFTVVNQSVGVVTRLPTIGQIVEQGRPLYWVSGMPVILLYGATPAYRSLTEGASPSDVSGPDVAELNADLVALGDATKAQINPKSDQFGWWTNMLSRSSRGAPVFLRLGALVWGRPSFCLLQLASPQSRQPWALQRNQGARSSAPAPLLE